MKNDSLSERPAAPRPATENYRLGTLVFLMAGTMLFAGLGGGYLVLRYASGAWPGPGLPHLPGRLAGFNTAGIAPSSPAFHPAPRSPRRPDAPGLPRWL